MVRTPETCRRWFDTKPALAYSQDVALVNSLIENTLLLVPRALFDEFGSQRL